MKRRTTRPVRIGNVTIGGDGPVVIQSMTTTTPEDLPGSLDQIAALEQAGCQLVRLAVPSIRAAEALAPLRAAMAGRGLSVPLVADVHFNPRAAYEAARHVEKVRINPGNFASSTAEARRRIGPLLDRLRERGAALRIGVNHGSLAPYMSEAFGHGPRGMVASALEYLRICRDAGYEQLVVAIKASNPALMVEANRLLVRRMREELMDYPIHLGVTEAGAGEDGRLRSAAGIGALLLEGIGETIRVSLTGDPVTEIAACREILRAVEENGRVPEGPARECRRPPAQAWGRVMIGGDHPPIVEEVTDSGTEPDPAYPAESLIGPPAEDGAQRWVEVDLPSPSWEAQTEGLRRLSLAVPPAWVGAWPGAVKAEVAALLTRLAERDRPPRLRWHFPGVEGNGLSRLGLVAGDLRHLTESAGFPPPAFSWSGRPLAAAGRRLAEGERPLLIPELPSDPWAAAVGAGSLLLDGMVDGLRVAAKDRPLAYRLLQATRRRLTRTEFISCPGCGRLAYDLEGAVDRLRRRVGHLPGLKLAVMGCAVNGPGEMADADFGYVGSIEGKVDLYAGRERVERGLTPRQAEDRLVDLLRQRGLWRDHGEAGAESGRLERRSSNQGAPDS